jgi:hypothetical protein
VKNLNLGAGIEINYVAWGAAPLTSNPENH